MYKKSVQPNTPNLNNNKKTAKVTDRAPSALQDKKNQTNTQFKNKDQHLLLLVKEYLQFNGYNRAYEILRSQKPSMRNRAQVNNAKSQVDKNLIVQLFDKGSRDEFLKQTQKYYLDQTGRRLQFQLQVYFCIYSIHPNLKKMPLMDKSSSQAFRKYLDSRGGELAGTSQFLSYFAIPFMHKPQEHGALAHIFTKDWILKLKAKLTEFLTQQVKTSSTGPNSSFRKNSHLQQMFYAATNNISSREECKQNCSHALENISIKDQMHDLKAVIENLQLRFRQFTQCSKVNLIESNRKWFFFARELFAVAKSTVISEKSQRLQKYQRFFGGSIDQHIQNNDISLFDRNSYAEDMSMVPDLTKNKITKKVEWHPTYQIDMSKIKVIFLQANLKQKQGEVCSLLKALKDRFVKLKNPFQRREIMIEYSRCDILGIAEQNYSIQKRLMLEGPSKVKEFYLRFMNYVSTDTLGLQYLTKSKLLISNLIAIFNDEHQFSHYRKFVLGILQRFSFSKTPRLQLIQNGIIPMIFRIFRQEREELSDFSIQYLTALMMNLSLRKQSKGDFQKYKTQLLQIVMLFIGCQNGQIKNYANGTIFLLLTFPQIREEAVKQGLGDMIKHLIQTRQEDMCSQQYHYILNRLNQQNDIVQLQESDEQEEGEAQEDDFQEEEEEESLSDSSSSQYIEGDYELADGEELLMKHYALLGPEAVRQQILTRSVLDQTSKRINNMTTSINRSRRMDNIFSQKHNVTTLQPQLAAILNRKK